LPDFRIVPIASRVDPTCDDKPGHDAVYVARTAQCLSVVMPGFMPGIHVFAALHGWKSWMAGTSPAMTLSTPRILLTADEPCPTRHAVVRLLQFRIGPQPNIHFSF